MPVPVVRLEVIVMSTSQKSVPQETQLECERWLECVTSTEDGKGAVFGSLWGIPRANERTPQRGKPGSWVWKNKLELISSWRGHNFVRLSWSWPSYHSCPPTLHRISLFAKAPQIFEHSCHVPEAKGDRWSKEDHFGEEEAEQETKAQLDEDLTFMK